MVGKRGWIRIVEAFVVILLVAGVSAYLFSKTQINNDLLKIKEFEISALKEIELNEALRINVLQSSPPIQSDEENFPGELRIFFKNLLPAYLSCREKICEINEICGIDYPQEAIEQEIYAHSVVISAENTIYKPKQLKIICWKN